MRPHVSDTAMRSFLEALARRHECDDTCNQVTCQFLSVSQVVTLEINVRRINSQYEQCGSCQLEGRKTDERSRVRGVNSQYVLVKVARNQY